MRIAILTMISRLLPLETKPRRKRPILKNLLKLPITLLPVGQKRNSHPVKLVNKIFMKIL